MDTTDFIAKARLLHGDRYDYTQTVYSGSHSRLIISCKEHGDFYQLACNHSAGMGCLKCAKASAGNRRRLTQEEFLIKANKAHNNSYEYSLTKYKDAKTKIEIICKLHGKFNILPSNHLSGSGCQICGRIISNNNQKISTSQFIKKAKNIHGLKYNYDKVSYINNKINVTINCKIHGDFLQTPLNHIKCQGCPQCGILVAAAKHVKPINDFVEKAKTVHGDKYDYSNAKHFGNRNIKVFIECLKCNKIFEQSPANHLRGAGCPDCAIENAAKSITGREGHRASKEHFVKKAVSIHGNKYDYSKSDYKTSKVKVLIYCPEHNTDFYITPDEFYQGTTGCKRCYLTESRGERKIRLWLENNKLRYEEEKKFESCRMNKKGIMRFDFYLPEHNLLIEYDGKQHFTPSGNPAWRGNPIIRFIQTQQRDKFKNNWAKNNNYKLIRIPYTEFKNINQILNKDIIGDK